ncbi:hypothetical protein HDU93_000803 [Gonapodya sp. JEL0774]|nr:hypothetical protein HDU93_000803 [Gonapodya sp. JEL0774]
MTNHVDSGTTLLQVMEALDILYSPTNPPSAPIVAQYQSFLINVQKLPLAWDLAALLLNVGWYGDPNPRPDAVPLVLIEAHTPPAPGVPQSLSSGRVNYMFFAAHTWAVKLSRDWDSLDTAHGTYTKFQDPSFMRDTILSWVIRLAFAGRRAPKLVLNKLMSAVVSFAIRAPPTFFPSFPASFASLCILASTHLISSQPQDPTQLHTLSISTCRALFPQLYDSATIFEASDGPRQEPSWPVVSDPALLETPLREIVVVAATTQDPTGAADVAETLVCSIFSFAGTAVDEVQSAELVGSRKPQIESAVSSALPLVVRLCTVVLQTCAPSPQPAPTRPRQDAAMELVRSAAQFVDSSVRWGLDTTTLALLPPYLLPHLLLCPSVQSLSDSLTFESACEALTSVVGAKSCTDRIATSIIGGLWGTHVTGKSWAKTLVQDAVILFGRLAQDANPLTPLIALLAQIGESFASYLARRVREMSAPLKPDSAGEVAAVKELLETALLISNWPGQYPDDEDISQTLLPCWSYLAESLTDVSDGNPKLPLSEVDGTLQIPVTSSNISGASGAPLQILRALVSVLVEKASYPAVYLQFVNWPDAALDQWRTYRTDAADTVVAVAGAVRGAVVGWLIEMAAEAMDGVAQREAWQPLESVLHLIRAAAEEIPAAESEHVPNVFSDVVARILQWQQPEETKRLPWTKRHPSHLPLAVNIVVAGLAQPDLAPAAASALKELCDNCRQPLAEGIEWLVGVYLETARNIQPLERTRVIEAVASVIQALPNTTASAPHIARVLTDVIGGIQVSLNAILANEYGHSKSLAVHKLEIVNGLNCLVAFMKGVREVERVEVSSDDESSERELPKPALMKGLSESIDESKEVVEGTWTVVDSIARRFSGENDVNDLTSLVSDMFNTTPRNNLLECATAIVCSSGPASNNEAIVASCMRLVQSITQRVTTIITSDKAVEEYPDLVQGYLDLLSQCTRSVPAVLVSLSPDAADYIFMKLVPTALTAQEKLAAKSVTGFLGEFLSKDVDGGEINHVVKQVVGRIGVDLVRELLVNVAGRSPRSMVPAISECLFRLCYRYPEATRAALIQCLGQDGFPSSRVDAAAKEMFVKEVLTGETVTLGSDGDTFPVIAGGMYVAQLQADIDKQAASQSLQALTSAAEQPSGADMDGVVQLCQVAPAGNPVNAMKHRQPFVGAPVDAMGLEQFQLGLCHPSAPLQQGVYNSHNVPFLQQFSNYPTNFGSYGSQVEPSQDRDQRMNMGHDQALVDIENTLNAAEAAHPPRDRQHFRRYSSYGSRAQVGPFKPPAKNRGRPPKGNIPAPTIDEKTFFGFTLLGELQL